MAKSLLSKGCFDYTASIPFQEEMVRLGMSGLTLKECGEYYGLDEKDWEEFCEENTITELRLRCGHAKAKALSGSQLISQIQSGKINAIMFYLKTQGGFTEKQALQLETTVKDVKMPEFPSDPVEAAKAYQNFIKSS